MSLTRFIYGARPKSHVVVSPIRSSLHPVSLSHRIWPMAGLTIGLICTAAWIVLLGYGLLRLV